MIHGNSKGVGLLGDYVDETAFRTFNTTYTNTKPYPILVRITYKSGRCDVVTGGFGHGGFNAPLNGSTVEFIVKSNQEYRFETAASPTIDKWVELK